MRKVLAGALRTLLAGSPPAGEALGDSGWPSVVDVSGSDYLGFPGVDAEAANRCDAFHAYFMA